MGQKNKPIVTNMGHTKRDTMSISQTVKTILAENNKSVSDIAPQIGVTRQTFSRKINGHSHFSYNELSNLSTILGVPLVEIIARTEAADRSQKAGAQ